MFDKTYLIQDAIKRAEEFGQWIELDDYMKGVLFYGIDDEKHIVSDYPRISYVSAKSETGDVRYGQSERDMPKMPHTPPSAHSR